MLHVPPDGLVLTDADGTNRELFAQGDKPVWSPDGERIAFIYDHNQDGVPLLTALDLRGERLWSRVVGSSPSWSPDGTRLAVEVTYPSPVVRVIDASSGEVLWEEPGGHPAWRP